MSYEDPQTGEFVKTFRPRCARCMYWKKQTNTYGTCSISRPTGFKSAYEEYNTEPLIMTPKSAVCDNFDSFSAHFNQV